MITVIIILVIGVLVGIYQAYDDGYGDFIDYMFGVVFGSILGLTGGLVIALILPADTEIKETVYRLETLQDNGSTTGHFFLGSGHIDGKMQYVFYYESDGYYRLMQVDHNLAKIKFSKQAIVRQFKEVKTKSVINKFALDFPVKATYIFEVPQGSIMQQYQLDAK